MGPVHRITGCAQNNSRKKSISGLQLPGWATLQAEKTPENTGKNTIFLKS